MIKKALKDSIDEKIENIIDDIRFEKNSIMENLEFEESDEIESYFFDRMKSRFKDMCPIKVPNSEYIYMINNMQNSEKYSKYNTNRSDIKFDKNGIKILGNHPMQFSKCITVRRMVNGVEMSVKIGDQEEIKTIEDFNAKCSKYFEITLEEDDDKKNR